jgi:hypothetical protein
LCGFWKAVGVIVVNANNLSTHNNCS